MKRIISIILIAICIVGCSNNMNADIDLTTMSQTMALSQLNQINQNPTQYAGKNIKMEGIFDKNEINGKTYYFCVKNDATQCCAIAMEFQPKNKNDIPNTTGNEIIIKGQFQIYTEDGMKYTRINNAEVFENN